MKLLRDDRNLSLLHNIVQFNSPKILKQFFIANIGIFRKFNSSRFFAVCVLDRSNIFQFNFHV